MKSDAILGHIPSRRRGIHDRVQTLVFKGLSTQVIARRLRVTVGHVNNVRRGLHIARPRGHATWLSLPEVERMAAAGASTREIAAHFGYGKTYIQAVQRARQQLNMVGCRGNGRIRKHPQEANTAGAQ